MTAKPDLMEYHAIVTEERGNTLTALIERFERQLDDHFTDIKAFCAVAKADDPEPPRYAYPKGSGESPFPSESDLHIAWRKRQELKAALYDALSTTPKG